MLYYECQAEKLYIDRVKNYFCFLSIYIFILDLSLSWSLLASPTMQMRSMLNYYKGDKCLNQAYSNTIHFPITEPELAPMKRLIHLKMQLIRNV